MNAVEAKVAASASTSVVTGVITWLLVSFVPAFHAGIPAPLATFLPFIVASVLGAASGYLAPHTARPGEAPAAEPGQHEHAGP